MMALTIHQGFSIQMALTKQNIIEEISDRLSLSPSEAKHSIEALLEAMKSTLASGEDLMVSGFGKFQVHDKAPRKGRNPATGQTMTLDKRRVVSFKCSGKLRGQINGITHE
jgi:integration host factor subunit alpha